MSVAEYTPGDWYAVLADGVVLLLAPSTPPEVVREVWASADGRGGLGRRLDALVRHGIGGLHPCAAVDLSAGAGVQVVLRGEVEVEVVRGARSEVLTAPEVVSWSEQAVDAAEEITVRVGGGPRGAALPLVSGVVRASRVRVRLDARVPEVVLPEEPVTAVPVAPVPAAPAVFAVSAVPPVPAAPAAPPVRAALPGPAGADDHDGLTILTGELASIRQNLPSWALSQTGDWPSGGLPVPPAAAGGAVTTITGTDAPAAAAVVTTAVAEAAARLVLSTGEVVVLDRPVLLGRAPQPERALPGARLVAVPSPQQDISRSHAQVQAVDGLLLVTDLYSTNGVTVAGGGADARRIPAGEPVAVQVGDVVDLGDGVTFVVEPGA